MAAARSRTQLPVGSLPWIHDENAQVTQFCMQETEDFTFSARNEVEWLNEHMGDIFNKNQINVTEIFKTPGKLRGKTPRTARKRNPLEVREPLTDVFSIDGRPKDILKPVVSTSKPTATFRVAEDPIVPFAENKTTKGNTDSGYHGLPEDDMDTDDLPAPPQSSAETNDTAEIFPRSPSHEQVESTDHPEERSTTDKSFQSAREEFTEKTVPETSRGEDDPLSDINMIDVAGQGGRVESEASQIVNVMESAFESDVIEKGFEEDFVVDESRSPSQGSSPARPLVRKSSLTFAALPAREPLTTKKSIGARVSGLNQLEQSKAILSRGSFLGRYTGGKSVGTSKQPGSAQEIESNEEEDMPTDNLELAREESDLDVKMTKLHNKSSTQRLHDKISMLGKSQPTRPTKSIQATAIVTNPSYPELPYEDSQRLQHIAGLASKAEVSQANEEDDDDWIQPPQEQQNASIRPHLPKSVTADVMEDIKGKQTISGQDFSRGHDETPISSQPSQSHQNKPFSGQIDEAMLTRTTSASQTASPAKSSNYTRKEMNNDLDLLSTTPVGSPSSKRYVDGPLSASKSKLQSIMKTARGLFSSSASLSAHAKLDTLSPSSKRKNETVPNRSNEGAFKDKLYPSLPIHSPAMNPAGRKTRSSSEKEKKRKESENRERNSNEMDSDRLRNEEGRGFLTEKPEMSKAPMVEVAQQNARPMRQSPRRTQNQDEPKTQPEIVAVEARISTMGPPAQHAPSQTDQMQKSKEPRRPIKPAREMAPKPKPQPVAIRVGTLSQGLRMNNAALSSSIQESLPPPPAKPPIVAKKASNASLHTATSNSSLKNSVISMTAKPKALIAAERKKEQDEKEAQRKLDQKREIERKRAAQQEEARKQEQLQRQDAERQRERERAAVVEDPKILAKKQAIEKRRLDMKKDQQRAPQRPVPDQAPSTHPSQAASTSRQELGGPRPPSRLHNVPDYIKPANNQPLNNGVKPNKRVFDPNADDEPFLPGRLQGGPAYQQNEGKRRKTEDENIEEVRIRPTMAPPIRQSGIRPGGIKPPTFNNHNYPAAPPPAPHHQNPNILIKSATTNQAYQQQALPSQLVRPSHHPNIGKYQSGKIPFADNPNPPHPSHPHKTSLQSRLAPQTAKSSPQYVNGENIHLDDIPTESEDESDEETKPKPANLPDWAQSPELRQLLMTQDENMDADAVFGPVQSPHMEEMFRERHHRFRSRTSSANWAGADRLTEEEIRRDVEARQRLRREGGWTFGL